MSMLIGPDNWALSEDTIRFMFRQLVSGLYGLHRAGFAHLDLKPDNIMLDSEFNLKLADLGFASDLSKKFVG